MRPSLINWSLLKGIPLVGISFLTASSLAQVDIQVDASGNGSRAQVISPLIYGANFASPSQAAALNLPLNRNGGNATTRYNWQSDATNSGSDWYFLTHATGGGPSQSIDEWIAGNVGSGVPGRTLSMITVPTIGWVAKLGSGGAWTWSFSVAKYGAQQDTEPWHPDAGNGVKPNGALVTGNDPNDANKPVTASYQQGWLQHLISTFGTALNGGVKYYLLDNEPALWHETHRDVMPNGVSMQGLFDRSLAAATLIKNIDPTSLVGGPEEWGWLGYKYSGSDVQWLEAHNWQGNPPDRAAHGNTDVAPWLLRQFKAAGMTAGKRLLDVFTLHYYPQGSYSWSDSSTNAQLWRNRATRSLWDPNYTDESWIGEKIRLIPQMKEWVASEYPGTKIGITEYTWGDDDNMSAAIAQADCLGIFGREGVDLATRWVCPSMNTLTFKAFQMYRNYDGNGGAFGNVGGTCTTAANPDELSAYCALNTSTRKSTVMLINKKLSGTTSVNVILVNSSRSPRASVYQFTQGLGIVRLSDVAGTNSRLSMNLPSQSVTLLVISS